MRKGMRTQASKSFFKTMKPGREGLRYAAGAVCCRGPLSRHWSAQQMSLSRAATGLARVLRVPQFSAQRAAAAFARALAAAAGFGGPV